MAVAYRSIRTYPARNLAVAGLGRISEKMSRFRICWSQNPVQPQNRNVHKDQSHTHTDSHFLFNRPIFPAAQRQAGPQK